MRDNLKLAILFLTGLGSGIVCTWFATKRKYEERANQEINDIREYYSNKIDDALEKAKNLEDEFRKESVNPVIEEDIEDAVDIINDEGYGETEPKKKEERPYGKPYVISPEEYGEIEDYEQNELTYYADGYLADDRDKLIDDVEELIGWESLDHFGDYEDDAVHVRNDERKIDYEILKDERCYITDILKR